MDNIIIRSRKEEFKELVLYTVFGNMTFVISIGSYAIFNVFFGINELIANALAWVFAVLFSYVTNKKCVFKVATPTKTAPSLTQTTPTNRKARDARQHYRTYLGLKTFER